jgi:hypothetical protein
MTLEAGDGVFHADIFLAVSRRRARSRVIDRLGNGRPDRLRRRFVVLTRPDADAHCNAVTITDWFADPDSRHIADPDPGRHTVSGADADTDADRGSHADSNANAHPHSDTNAHANAYSYADAHANADTNTYSYPDPNAESRTETDGYAP